LIEEPIIWNKTKSQEVVEDVKIENLVFPSYQSFVRKLLPWLMTGEHLSEFTKNKHRSASNKIGQAL
jgi:hypothetical protein